MQIDNSIPGFLVFGVITALIAADRGRSAIGWFFIGGFLPCIGIVLVLVLPDLRREEQELSRTQLENRRLNEQLRKERMVADVRHSQVSQRLEVHDKALGVDTARQIGAIQPIAALPPPPIPNPRAVEWWYVQDGERMGPVSFQTLKSLYEVRAIDGQTPVWCEQMSDWELIGALQDLERELCA